MGATPSGYSVQRTGPSQAPVCTAVTTTTCTDTGLVPSTAYTYEIRALVGIWRSPALVTAATTLPPSPAAFVVVVEAPTTVTAGAQVTLTIQARNDAGADDPSYAGDHTLSFSGPGTVGGNAPSYPGSVTFDSTGLASNVKVRLYMAQVVTITVADPAAPQRTGVSNAVTVLPGPASRLLWTTDAAGLTDACPLGTVSVGVGGQRSWYVALLDGYGNRAIQGGTDGTVTVRTTSGNGTPPNGSLTVNAGANPAVTSTALTMKLKKKSGTATTWRASMPSLTAVSCTLSP